MIHLSSQDLYYTTFSKQKSLSATIFAICRALNDVLILSRITVSFTFGDMEKDNYNPPSFTWKDEIVLTATFDFFSELDFGFGLGYSLRIASGQIGRKTELALETSFIQVPTYTPVWGICKPLRLFLQHNKAVINTCLYISLSIMRFHNH